MRAYMHTIDGRPGWFDGEQIVFAEPRDRWRDDYSLVMLRKTVAEIRNDQRRSEAFRKKHKWNVPEYDFVIVSDKRGVIPYKEPKL